jgi:plasmid replication initiation protein
MTLTLPDWLYQGVIGKGGVLTIHEDYFLLTGGIERWLYRVARKHAGKQEHGWGFTMRQLHEKSGSLARLSDFALDVRKLVEQNTLPEYAISLRKNDEGEEVVHFLPRTSLATKNEWRAVEEVMLHFMRHKPTGPRMTKILRDINNLPDN